MERARVALSWLILSVLARSLAAQTCDSCSGAFTLPAYICDLPGKIQEGDGCSDELKNCQTPELLPPRMQIVSTGPSTYEARLTVQARAAWNSDSSVLSAGRLKLFWGPFDWCEDGSTDRPETYLRFPGLTCAGAPYNLGTYSLNAVVCQGGGSCQKTVQVSGMVAAVPKSMLCTEPPKWTCCGDGSCRDCIQVGPGFASPAGEGASASPPGSGPGAVLSYRAGGVGGAGWPGTAVWNVTLGRHWAHTFSERLVQDPGVGHVWLLARDATFREFTDANLDGTYETVSPSDEHRDLFKVPTGWELRSLDGTVQSFDAAGLWTQTVDRNGNAKVAQYTSGVLTRVTLPDGRREDFEYHPDGKLKKIVEVGVDGATSRAWTYTWTGHDLTRIDRPDGTAWELFYSNAGLPGYLTRIDLRGTAPGTGRAATGWEYDSRGNVIKIWSGDPVATDPNAVDLHVLAYDTPVLPTRTSVTDALGRTLGFYFQRDPVSRKPRLIRYEDGCPACGSKARTKYEYADAANPLLPDLRHRGRRGRPRPRDHPRIRRLRRPSEDHPAAGQRPGVRPRLGGPADVDREQARRRDAGGAHPVHARQGRAPHPGGPPELERQRLGDPGVDPVRLLLEVPTRQGDPSRLRDRTGLHLQRRALPRLGRQPPPRRERHGRDSEVRLRRPQPADQGHPAGRADRGRDELCL